MSSCPGSLSLKNHSSRRGGLGEDHAVVSSPSHKRFERENSFPFGIRSFNIVCRPSGTRRLSTLRGLPSPATGCFVPSGLVSTVSTCPPRRWDCLQHGTGRAFGIRVPSASLRISPAGSDARKPAQLHYAPRGTREGEIFVALRSELVTFLGLLLKRHVILVRWQACIPQE